MSISLSQQAVNAFIDFYLASTPRDGDWERWNAMKDFVVDAISKTSPESARSSSSVVAYLCMACLKPIVKPEHPAFVYCPCRSSWVDYGKHLTRCGWDPEKSGPPQPLTEEELKKYDATCKEGLQDDASAR
jgi:hypothetical protein